MFEFQQQMEHFE